MFSDDLLDAIVKEAEALDVRGATPITVLLRNQLTTRKKHGAGVTDERHRTYWLAGRVVDAGVSYPVPGVAEITGLAMAGSLGTEVLKAHYGQETVWGVGAAIEEQTPAARVSLTRKGQAHFSRVISERPVGAGVAATSWLDLYVFNDPDAAQKCADELPVGKVF